VRSSGGFASKLPSNIANLTNVTNMVNQTQGFISSVPDKSLMDDIQMLPERQFSSQRKNFEGGSHQGSSNNLLQANKNISFMNSTRLSKIGSQQRLVLGDRRGEDDALSRTASNINPDLNLTNYAQPVDRTGRLEPI
jgi:hypothetical protein